MLYLLTRMGGARDWGTGLPLKASLLGKMSRLEVHHIFPKAQLYKWNYRKSEVNALANFCFLTKETNLSISDRLPEEYFKEIQANHPGALASQWIPEDPELWKIENYLAFLEARKTLLAGEANHRMTELIHGDVHWLEGPSRMVKAVQVVGDITGEDEEQELKAANAWVTEQGLPGGILSYEYASSETGDQLAVFDLAWPNGIQKELSQPVALLLNEPAETIAVANQAGFRCFTSSEDFRRYVIEEILAEVDA